MKCPRCFFSDVEVGDEICRRCSRNFTRGELLEIALLGLMYLFICRFSYYLFTGDFFSDPLGGGAFFPVRFAEVLTFPVNLSEDPWHILTVGWTFALVVLVPMLVGLFYGAVPGVIVAFVGGYHVPAPFFFLLLMLGALMAGTRVRNLLHIETSILLGAVPAAVCLFVLSLPALLGKLGITAWLPWVVMIVLVAAPVSPVLWLARRRAYNARFLMWVVALQVLAVLVVFEVGVGFGRIEYAFVRRNHSAAAPAFRIMVAPAIGGRTTEMQRDTARSLCQQRREQALEAFSRYVSWFPRSAETPLALFERAEMRNLRSYLGGARPERLRTYTDRIAQESLDDYQTIRTDFSKSPAAPVSRLCAARYALQHNQLDQAVRELRDLVDFCNVKVPLDFRPEAATAVLDRWRRHRLRGDEHTQLLYEVLQEARLELRFLEHNSDYNRIPLMLFYQLDKHQDDYAAELAKILKWFPDSRLADNIKLRLLERGRYRMETLEELLAEHPKGDVAPRMLLLLGEGYYDRLMYTSSERFLRRLVAEFPDSPEAARAAILLKSVTADSRKASSE